MHSIGIMNVTSSSDQSGHFDLHVENNDGQVPIKSSLFFCFS